MKGKAFVLLSLWLLLAATILNVQVPLDVPSGPEQPVEIIIDGVTSNIVTVSSLEVWRP